MMKKILLTPEILAATPNLTDAEIAAIALSQEILDMTRFDMALDDAVRVKAYQTKVSKSALYEIYNLGQGLMKEWFIIDSNEFEPIGKYIELADVTFRNVDANTTTALRGYVSQTENYFVRIAKGGFIRQFCKMYAVLPFYSTQSGVKALCLAKKPIPQDILGQYLELAIGFYPG